MGLRGQKRIHLVSVLAQRQQLSWKVDPLTSGLWRIQLLCSPKWKGNGKVFEEVFTGSGLHSGSSCCSYPTSEDSYWNNQVQIDVGVLRVHRSSAALDPPWNQNPPGRPAYGAEPLQTGNYSLVLLIQLSLLSFDLFVNSFSELLRHEQAVQLILFIIQDIAILFNLIIILLMLFNTYVFQVGLVAVLLERFRALLMLSALYLTFSIILHSWIMNLRWLNTNRFIWTDGLQVLFVFQRAASVLYYYFYKRTSEYLGDPRLYEDSPWLRDVFERVRH
nr:transmembrane protein 138-like [Nerophis lumbriciformis]